MLHEYLSELYLLEPKYHEIVKILMKVFRDSVTEIQGSSQPESSVPRAGIFLRERLEKHPNGLALANAGLTLLTDSDAYRYFEHMIRVAHEGQKKVAQAEGRAARDISSEEVMKGLEKVLTDAQEYLAHEKKVRSSAEMYEKNFNSLNFITLPSWNIYKITLATLDTELTGLAPETLVTKLLLATALTHIEMDTEQLPIDFDKTLEWWNYMIMSKLSGSFESVGIALEKITGNAIVFGIFESIAREVSESTHACLFAKEGQIAQWIHVLCKKFPAPYEG